MDGFHQMRVLHRVLFKGYNCLSLQDWFVDFGTIAAGSVSPAFEGRHYCRSIHQRRAEDTTYKFELIHPDLLNNLSELKQSFGIRHK